MWHPRLSTYLPVMAGVLVLGCGETPDPGAGPRTDLPGEPTAQDDSDQPIRLAYLCGNQFLVTNAYSVPVILTWRVSGTGEQGTVQLPAAPTEDPAFSEQVIETRTAGTVQLRLDDRPLRTRRNEQIPCSPSAPAEAQVTGGAPSAGSWSAPFSWPIVALHLHLLPNGKVLSWGHYGDPRLWNPSTGAFTVVPSPALLFCAGHSFTTDGRLVSAGGHISDNHGLPNITLFKASSASWSNAAPMQRGRWYPTATTMASGQVAITAGRDEAGNNVPLPEVWSSSGIRVLSSASLELPYYPRAFLAPNGKLFVAGEGQTSRYLSISGSGSWSTVGLRKYGTRDYGSAVMYEPGKILYTGGGHTTNTAEVVDLNKAAPAWQWTGSMAFARRHLNAVLLPTGEVLVTGGVSGTGWNDLSKAVYAAEIWNPTTGLWTTLASNAIPRGYHAASILLPSGKVLHTGSGDAAGSPNQKNAELFSPPYLFKGARPSIQSAPTQVLYSTTFRVSTGNAGSITKVSIIRLGSVTHAFDMNQRFQRLAFTADATGLNVSAPTDRRRTPPGHYMLFILNGTDVPSVAKIVQVK